MRVRVRGLVLGFVTCAQLGLQIRTEPLRLAQRSLSKARLKRVSSTPAWALLVWGGSRPVWHTAWSGVVAAQAGGAGMAAQPGGVGTW